MTLRAMMLRLVWLKIYVGITQDVFMSVRLFDTRLEYNIVFIPPTVRSLGLFFFDVIEALDVPVIVQVSYLE